MRVRLFCDERELFVSPFIAKFTANVSEAVARSLKAPSFSKKLGFLLEGQKVRIQIDSTGIPLDGAQGFAETIVRDTLRGMLQHLKGIDPDGSIRIEIDLEGELEQKKT